MKALRLEDGRRHQRLRDYVQVWHEDAWLLYDPRRGRVDGTGELLMWQTGTPAVVDVVGGGDAQPGDLLHDQPGALRPGPFPAARQPLRPVPAQPSDRGTGHVETLAARDERGPGLAIQIANGSGLDGRLEAVLPREAFAPTVDERVAFSLEGLGGSVG